MRAARTVRTYLVAVAVVLTASVSLTAVPQLLNPNCSLLTPYPADALGRLVAVTNAMGHATLYEYDAAGNLAAQTDANGHTTRFAYDAMGRRVSRVLPGGQTETYTYDAAGNMASKTDFNGKTTTYRLQRDRSLEEKAVASGGCGLVD